MIAVDLKKENVLLNRTENLFVDNSLICDIVREEAIGIDFTSKKFPDAKLLREAIAEYYEIDSEWICVGVGSSQILDCILCRFSDYAIIDVVPNFPLASKTASKLRMSYIKLEVRESEELIQKLKAIKKIPNRTILILSSPRNPYGYCFSAEQIIELTEFISGPVIIDEAYVDFSDQQFISLINCYHNLILVRTFSKAWGLSNLRVGYALSRLLNQE